MCLRGVKGADGGKATATLIRIGGILTTARIDDED